MYDFRFYNNKNYDTENGKITTPLQIVRNKEKIWAHRVNSLGKLQLAKKKFSGVELDIVFAEKNGQWYFDVNHPPYESIALSLDEYFASLDNPNQLKLWLDFKNLSKSG